jgi:hypothetical protein
MLPNPVYRSKAGQSPGLSPCLYQRLDLCRGVIGGIVRMKRWGIPRLRHLRFTSMSALGMTGREVDSGGAHKPDKNDLSFLRRHAKYPDPSAEGAQAIARSEAPGNAWAAIPTPRRGRDQRRD